MLVFGYPSCYFRAYPSHWLFDHLRSDPMTLDTPGHSFFPLAPPWSLLSEQGPDSLTVTGLSKGLLAQFCTGAAGSPGIVQGPQPSTSNMQQDIKWYATQNPKQPHVLKQAFPNSSLFHCVFFQLLCTQKCTDFSDIPSNPCGAHIFSVV